MFSFFNLNYWLNQRLGTVFSHPVSSGVSNGKFSQKVIWGKKNRSCSGTRMSVKSVSPFNLISFLFMSQMEDSYLFWKSSHAFNCLQYLSFLKCFHPTLFCSFNTDFKCSIFLFKSDFILLCFAVLILTLNVCFLLANALPFQVFSGAVRVINWIILQHLLLWLLILWFSSVLLHESLFAKLCIYQWVPAAQTTRLRMLIETF